MKLNIFAKSFFATICILLIFSGAQAATLKIGPKGEQLMFDKTTFTVKAGEKVELTLNNTSGMCSAPRLNRT
jgi:plastocyanin